MAKRNKGRPASVPGQATVLLVGLILCASTGCTQKQRPTATSLRDQPEEYAQAVVVDRSLRKWMRVEGMRARRLPDNRLRVDVKAMNLTARAQVIDVKFKFKDAEGFDIDETNWMPRVLRPNEITSLRADSLKNTAADFTVLFRLRRTGTEL